MRRSSSIRQCYLQKRANLDFIHLWRFWRAVFSHRAASHSHLDPFLLAVALTYGSRACNNLHWTETDLGRFSQERPRFLCISETSSNRSKSLMMSICVHRLTLQWARIWNEKTTKIENFFIWQESWKTSCLLESCMIKKNFESLQFRRPFNKVRRTSKLLRRLKFYFCTTQEI